MWLFYKLHELVVAAVWGLARLLGRSVGRFLLAVWLLLNEEVRRYFGLAVWGVLIVLAGKGTLNYAPAGTKEPLLLSVLLLLGIWALAVRRAVRITKENNLIKVQNRKAFRDLRADVQGTRRDMLEGLARATRGRRVGLLFGSNRQRNADEQAAAEAAAAQVAREQAAEVAWEQAVAAKRAEREQFAEAARNRLRRGS